jgi:hypothetical protein
VHNIVIGIDFQLLLLLRLSNRALGGEDVIEFFELSYIVSIGISKASSQS